MHISIDLHQYAKKIVSTYAYFDTLVGQYVLDSHQLPDFVREELTALLMASNEDSAYEAIGPDNPLYETKMLPLLIKHLQNATNQDTQIEFANKWRECITSYYQDVIEDVLEEALYSLNEEEGFLKKKHPINSYAFKGSISVCAS